MLTEKSALRSEMETLKQTMGGQGRQQEGHQVDPKDIDEVIFALNPFYPDCKTMFSRICLFFSSLFYIVKSKIFSFLKLSLAFRIYKHLTTQPLTKISQPVIQVYQLFWWRRVLFRVGPHGTKEKQSHLLLPPPPGLGAKFNNLSVINFLTIG